MTDLSGYIPANILAASAFGCAQCGIVVEQSPSGTKLSRLGFIELVYSIALFSTASNYNLGVLDFRDTSQWD
jgi:hypothetical protein